MPAGEERPRLAPVPPPESGARESAPGPKAGGGGARFRLVLAAAAALVLLAAVALVGWMRAAGEVEQLEGALAARTRALEAARAELRAWEGHRDAVGARLESLSGELEAVRDLLARGPGGEEEASAASEPPAEAPAR